MSERETMRENQIAADREFEDLVVTKVMEGSNGGWTLVFDTGWVFFCPPFDGTPPRVGSKVRQYGKGRGHTVRGLIVDGQVVFYRRTDAERLVDLERDGADK